MNKLLENMKIEQSKTFTENGATAFNDTGEDLVNLFGVIGALRCREGNDIANMFSKAFADDKLLATKMAFYARDVRGGLGERRTGRILFKTLSEIAPEVLKKNLHFLPEYGRWDDLVELLDTSVAKDAAAILVEQLNEDVENMKKGKPISILSKWLPSINTSSVKTRKKAEALIQFMGIDKKTYRKTLSALRAYLNVTEVRMSAKDYNLIRYDEVPSLAMNRYRVAFLRNDSDRFIKYKESLKKGEAKINASTLYPYDIVEKYLYSVRNTDDILEEQWKALPNYVEGENNFLIMADVSGSMSGRPMATSIGLAIYFAERNKGAFHNKFMTFSYRPELVTIKGETLNERIRNVKNADWEMNTNLHAAFKLVLDTAVKHQVPKEDMPTSIVVISDMEIDACADVDNWGFYDEMKKQFEEVGYEIPNIVFWNVNARQNTFHADAKTKGVQLASGQSASVFETLIKGEFLTPYEYMLSVLNTERYDKIAM